MTPEQQQAAARVAVHQIRMTAMTLRQAAGLANRLVGTGYVTDEFVDLFVEAVESIERLSECATACIDNAEQSDRVKE